MSIFNLLPLKTKDWDEHGDDLAISKDGGNVGLSLFRSTIPAQPITAESKKALEQASLFFNSGQTNSVVNADETLIQPLESQMVSREFRGLSQTLLRYRGLDFTTKGVLEEGVEMLQGKTVYPNHSFRDINKALGVVSKAWWDSAGAESGGVPGINCEIKVDALMNLRISRLLMMDPPAINRMSLTVLFEFDYSHPKLVEDRKFWSMIGEEVDGQIVRLIVTKIIEIWEASLVFMGEDRLAKGMPKDTEETEEGLEAKANLNKEKTMNLTDEQKTLLGISHEGDDVPEETVKNAVIELAKKTKGIDLELIATLTKDAKEGKALLEAKREEIKSLATLAEFGGEEGELNEVLSKMIDNATSKDLLSLETKYRNEIGDKFPKSGRSSFENPEDIEDAGDVNTETKPAPVNVDGFH